MHRSIALTIALLVGFLFDGRAPESPSEPPPAEALSVKALPAPYQQTVLAQGLEPLVLSDSSSHGKSLYSILRAFAEVTDQQVVMDAEVEQLVSAITLKLRGDVEVPPSEVYAFLEGVLLSQGIVMASVKEGAIPILGVYSLHRNGISLAPYLSVLPEETGAYANHPALLVQTVLELEHTDVRSLQTQVRPLAGQSYQALLAVGGTGMVVRGTGSWVASMTEMLMAVDRMSEKGLVAPEGE